MKMIEVYDIEAEDLEELAEKHDTSVANVVESLLAAVNDSLNGIDIADYL